MHSYFHSDVLNTGLYQPKDTCMLHNSNIIHSSWVKLRMHITCLKIDDIRNWIDIVKCYFLCVHCYGCVDLCNFQGTLCGARKGRIISSLSSGTVMHPFYCLKVQCSRRIKFKNLSVLHLLPQKQGTVHHGNETLQGLVLSGTDPRRMFCVTHARDMPISPSHSLAWPWIQKLTAYKI